jgi:hypothetical protein
MALAFACCPRRTLAKKKPGDAGLSLDALLYQSTPFGETLRQAQGERI